jgi:competence protein ComEC
LDDEVWLDILFPDRPIREGDANAASIVARLQYGEQIFLLTGDAPRAIENYLLATMREALDATVLKLGHHGSDTSSGEAWLAAASPEYAVISVGADNRYGHPAPEVLERLAVSKARILRTDQEGTIVFQTDGETMQISNN